MPTSLELSQIDELLLADHSYLCEEDECYFLREYTSRMGFAHSDTNKLIANFKKSPERKGRPEWRYKKSAIAQVAREFGGALSAKGLMSATLVPMPPSKAVGDPLYDSRLVDMLSLIPNAQNVRPLLRAKASRRAAHESDNDRPTIDELVANLEVDEELAIPSLPSLVWLFDDVVVNGTNFVAGKRVLKRRFPNVKVVGLFIARRVFGGSDGQ